MFKLSKRLILHFLIVLGVGGVFSSFALSAPSKGDPLRPGGEGTTRSESIDAFSFPVKNIKTKNRKDFFVGKSFFRQNWVTFPSSVKSLEGLGPTFIAQSCIACHDRDGRGAHPDDAKGEFRALLLRLSIPGQGAHGEPLEVPNYGDQIQNFSIEGVLPEGKPQVKWTEIRGQFNDGESYTLMKPEYSINDLAFGDLPKDVQISPRIAPSVIGLGLLASIDESDILKQADPEDKDGDGIRGRPNRVWDFINSKHSLGRFGWKANQAGLRQQNVGAFMGDMGISTPYMPGQNCPSVQKSCLEAPKKATPEISEKDLESLHAYMALLSVPARRGLPPEIEERGSALMKDLSCVKCHTPSYRTSANAEFAENRGQWIYPYTDLLLHDMGEGLADHRPDFEAGPRDWRTPPLWGIGLIKKVNRHSRLLHDGRARSMEEAILWHGGEAAVASAKYRALNKADRKILTQYLESL